MACKPDKRQCRNSVLGKVGQHELNNWYGQIYGAYIRELTVSLLLWIAQKTDTC